MRVPVTAGWQRGRMEVGDLNAGIIGLNWGRVHIGTLRAAGVSVDAVCARDPREVERVAREEGIPRATTHPGDLADLDIVVIATPPASHGALMSRFPAARIICEKPLFGLSGNGVRRPESSPPVFVNYAFAFLDTARMLKEQLRRVGPVAHVRLDSRVSLPGTFNVMEWFMETASHPLSWLRHVFGPASTAALERSGNSLSLSLRAGGDLRMDVRFQVGGERGIQHTVSVRAAGGTLSFSGGYAPGDSWRFSPVLRNAAPVNDGEWLPDDCWIRANHRSVGTMIEVFEGALSHEAGLARGLFDPPKAHAVEAALATGT
jgi:dTDP-4-dehydrorhamnose reductase